MMIQILLIMINDHEYADDDDRFEFGGAASAGYEQTDTSS